MNDNKNFNRRYTLSFPYNKFDIDLSILFNTYNTYMAYHIDQQTYRRLTSKFNITTCFNLSKSAFSTFLDISNKNDDGLNCYGLFNGIYTQFKDIMYYDDNESVNMNKVFVCDSFVYNKIDINVIRLNNFPKDFVYIICNRNYINDKTKKRIVRSSSFCISNSESQKYLSNLYKKYKTSGDKFETCEDAIKSLFKNESELTPQQIQNGFQL